MVTKIKGALPKTNLRQADPRILRTGFLSFSSSDGVRNPKLGKKITFQLSAHAKIAARVVERLPRYPRRGETYLLYNDRLRSDVTMHNLARFPAKLHPPLVSWAITRYTRPGDNILDPFCGCGTVVLEATLRGRKAVGFDIDPYAALLAGAKANPPRKEKFHRVVRDLYRKLGPLQRASVTYKRLAKGDISLGYFHSSLNGTNLPPIPRSEHWFKRYVLIDLARIWHILNTQGTTGDLKRFILTSFASMVRLCSNADPDTLSGIEVTNRMRKWLKRGRYLNPYQIFANRLERNLKLVDGFWKHLARSTRAERPRIYVGSALLRNSYRIKKESVDLILTSPPYCSAVEYDRRHMFEHYWLGFLKNDDDVRRLRRGYIGRRHYVYGNAEELAEGLPKDVRSRLFRSLGAVLNTENERARAIVRYFLDMSQWFELAKEYLRPGGHLILVIGNSTVRGNPIHTSRLLVKMAPPELKLNNSFSYVLRNRSMQYSRWNQANVATENVMVFMKKPSSQTV